MKHLFLLVVCCVAATDGWGQWVEPPQFEWARTFGGFGTNWDDNVHLRGMEIDSDENVYVCGFFENFMCFGEDTCVYSTTPDSSDIFLVKYDSLGNLLWLRTFGEGGIDEAVGLGVTPSQEVLLAINFTGVLVADDFTLTASTPDRYLYDAADCAVLHINAEGKILDYDRPQGEHINLITRFSINRTGEYFITGVSISDSLYFNDVLLPVTARQTFFLAGYTQNGNLIYAQRLFSRGMFENLEVDNLGQVYIEGYFTDSMRIGEIVLSEKEGNQRFIIKLSSSGELVWNRIFTSPQIDIRHLASDSENNLYVSANVGMKVNFDSIELNGGYSLLKLNQNMEAVWGYELGRGTFRGGYISVIDRAVYVAGIIGLSQAIEDTVIYSQNTNGMDNPDILLLRHDPETGELVWFKHTGWTGREAPGIIHATDEGRIYSLGWFKSAYSSLDSIQLQNPYPGISYRFLAKTFADSLPPRLQIPEDDWLIYPNPVQNILWIAGQWQDGEASIEMFSMDGRLVMNQTIQADSNFRKVSLHIPPSLAAGMYVIRIRQGERERSYKVLKIN